MASPFRYMSGKCWVIFFVLRPAAAEVKHSLALTLI